MWHVSKSGPCLHAPIVGKHESGGIDGLRRPLLLQARGGHRPLLLPRGVDVEVVDHVALFTTPRRAVHDPTIAILYRYCTGTLSNLTIRNDLSLTDFGLPGYFIENGARRGGANHSKGPTWL